MEANFETATRRKLRFQTTKGNLSIEDLWDVPLTVLDEAYKGLSRQIREAEDDSLLSKKDSGVEEASLKRDLVKHVVQVRQAEAEAKTARAARRQQAARVRELIAQKQDEALAGKSTDELNTLLAELEG